MPDIVELILGDHARIRELLAEVETALAHPDGTDARAELPGRWEKLAALLEAHADAAEEIGYPAVFGHAATVARDNARATDNDIREAVGETRLHPAGSLPWQLAVLAGCTAAMDHIHNLESALVLFRREASMPVREAMGRQWMTYMTASLADSTRHDPS